MNTVNTYHFALVLHRESKCDNIEDLLFDAGCDDALINFRGNTVYLDFDREAKSIEDAVISAIKDVERSPFVVVGVTPDPLVTMVDIANRLNVKRQAVSLWLKEQRRNKIPFPGPIMKLNDKSPLWKWFEVVEWLYQHKEIKDNSMVKEARFFDALNSALQERSDKKMRDECHKLAGFLPPINEKRSEHC